MTPAEAQAVMAIIDGNLEGRTGNVKSISIGETGVAKVIIDYTTFAEVFTGTDVDQTGSNVRKTTGQGVTYVADLPSTGTHSVP
jgi:hypothetical protein